MNLEFGGFGTNFTSPFEHDTNIPLKYFLSLQSFPAAGNEFVTPKRIGKKTKINMLLQKKPSWDCRKFNDQQDWFIFNLLLLSALVTVASIYVQ